MRFKHYTGFLSKNAKVGIQIMFFTRSAMEFIAALGKSSQKEISILKGLLNNS